jgi:hypothetical protein
LPLHGSTNRNETLAVVPRSSSVSVPCKLKQLLTKLIGRMPAGTQN